jgi:acyl carrier protein
MVARQVKGFILKNFLFTDDSSALQDDQSLIAAGTLDSTGILELITFVEEHFGMKVEDSEMIPENFDSVSAIATFVARKQNSA